MKKDWFIHTNDTDKQLFVSRPKPNPGGAFSPCNMSPDDVDYEMSFGKSKKILEICGMEQKSFEYFVEKYGAEYEYLSFFKCQLISDFSPPRGPEAPPGCQHLLEYPQQYPLGYVQESQAGISVAGFHQKDRL